MRIDGTCHCGFVTFEAEVDPEETTICHCADCQRFSGAPFRTSIAAKPENFRLLAGEPAIYVKTADSGRKRIQAFCPKCGTALYATALDDPTAAYNIRVGSVRQRAALVPRRQIWARSAQPWIGDLASIPRVEGD